MADRRRGGRLPRTLRRVAAGALVLAAGVIALSPPDVANGEPVLVATRDLSIGMRLQAQDVQVTQLAQVPDGALRDPADVLGRELAGRMRNGEIVTDVRLADPVGPDPGPGRVAVPIRPADPAIVGLLGPGMHVAVIAVADDGSAAPLAQDAVVLVVPPVPERGSADRPIVLSVPAESADRLVAAALVGTIAFRFT